MDKVVQKLVALGIPGLVLLVVVATSGLVGGAALVAALAALGGPFGMLGGIAVLGILALVSDAVAEYGMPKIFMAVVKGLLEKGYTKEEIREKISGYPITDALKRKILDELG
jgi:hypothetical protein